MSARFHLYLSGIFARSRSCTAADRTTAKAQAAATLVLQRRSNRSCFLVSHGPAGVVTPLVPPFVTVCGACASWRARSRRDRASGRARPRRAAAPPRPRCRRRASASSSAARSSAATSSAQVHRPARDLDRRRALRSTTAARPGARRRAQDAPRQIGQQELVPARL